MPTPSKVTVGGQPLGSWVLCLVWGHGGFQKVQKVNKGFRGKTWPRVHVVQCGSGPGGGAAEQAA